MDEMELVEDGMGIYAEIEAEQYSYQEGMGKILMSQFDDDPNPYHGYYSEEF